MERTMEDMKTANGLVIKRVNDERGGFHIDLHRPPEHDSGEKPFASLKRDERGRWVANRDGSAALAVQIHQGRVRFGRRDGGALGRQR